MLWSNIRCSVFWNVDPFYRKGRWVRETCRKMLYDRNKEGIQYLKEECRKTLKDLCSIRNFFCLLFVMPFLESGFGQWKTKNLRLRNFFPSFNWLKPFLNVDLWIFLLRRQYWSIFCVTFIKSLWCTRMSVQILCSLCHMAIRLTCAPCLIRPWCWKKASLNFVYSFLTIKTIRKWTCFAKTLWCKKNQINFVG